MHTIGYTTPKVVDVALTGRIVDTLATDRRGKHTPAHSMKEGDKKLILASAVFHLATWLWSCCLSTKCCTHLLQSRNGGAFGKFTWGIFTWLIKGLLVLASTRRWLSTQIIRKTILRKSNASFTLLPPIHVHALIYTKPGLWCMHQKWVQNFHFLVS